MKLYRIRSNAQMALFTLCWLISLSLFSQTPVTVTATGGTPVASYPTLKDAFDAINAGTHQNSIVIDITDNVTESASAVLNASGSGSASYTDILVRPSGGASRIVQGNLANSLMTLNGANQVTIDGLNSGGNALTLRNTNTSATASTLTFIGGASNNTVTNCTIEGSGQGSGTASLDRGIIFFSTGGNSNNTIRLCNLTSAGSNKPRNVIYSFGTSGSENINNTIEDNLIYDFLHLSAFSSGVHLDLHTSQWTIRGNSFFQTTAFAPVSSVDYRIIDITNTSGNQFTITNNYIGGSQAFCGGTAWTKTSQTSGFCGMYISVGTATASEIHGNVIQNIQWTDAAGASWYGIWIHTGLVNLGTSNGNTIGAASGTGSIVHTSASSGVSVYGIYLANNAVVDCRNNTISSITVSSSGSTNATHFWGIFKTGAGNTTISQNNIGHAGTPHSIQITSASNNNAQTLIGIQSLGTGNVTISGNTIAQMQNGTTNSNTATLGYVHGIQVTAGTNIINNNIIRDLSIANANNTSLNTASIVGISFSFVTSATQEISGNTIFNLSNTRSDFTGNVIGLYYNGSSSASSVTGNHIYGLSVDANSNAASLQGIRINAGSTTYANNLISLGGNTQTTIYGIFDVGTSGTTQLYFNTIYISGAPTTGTNSSSAIWSNNSSNIRNFRNNILVNARSNNGASGSHYALWLNYGVVTSNFILEYNTYFVSGTGGVLGRYNSLDVNTLPIAPDRDYTSFQVDPNLTNPSGNSISDFLPQAPQLSGIVISGITNDILGVTRGSRVSLGALQYQTLGRIQVLSTGGLITDTTYNLIKEVFDAVNAGTHTGVIQVKINASILDNQATAILNESGTGSASYSQLSIYPTANNLLLRGDIASGALMEFSGADQVTIDGRVNRTGSTIQLDIENISTTNALVLNFWNDARMDTLQYCRVKGSSTGLLRIGAGSTLGNSNLVIANNYFTRTNNGQAPLFCIESNTGGTGPLNRDIIIRSNQFANYFRPNAAGVSLNILHASHFTVDSNSFFQDIAITVSSGPLTYNNLTINSPTGFGFNVNHNFIGGSQPLCQGVYFEGGSITGLNPGFNAMWINVSNTVGEESFIDGNTIANIRWRNNQVATGQQWVGIRASGNIQVGSLFPNLIGSNTVNNSLFLMAGGGAIGILATGRASIINNVVAGVEMEFTPSEFIGIAAEGNNLIQGNTIGSTQPSSISHTSSNGRVTGIRARAAITSVIENNTIQNLINTNTGNGSGSIRGIQYVKTSPSQNADITIRQNIIRSLSTRETGSAARVLGIDVDDAGNSGTFALIVQDNQVSQLLTENNNPNTGPLAGIIGMYVRHSATSTLTIKGNTISELTNSSTAYSGHIAGISLNTINTGPQIRENFVRQLVLNSNNTSAICFGLYNHAGAPQVFNNIVVIGEDKPIQYIGIGDYSSSNSAPRSFSFNTVRLGGTPTSGDRLSAAFWSESTTGTKDYQNNLLVNNRSNGGSATGSHYAIYLNYASAGNITLEYNNYFANGTGGVLGYFNSTNVNTVPLLAEGDYTSFALDPLFANPSGNLSTHFIPGEPLLCGTTISGITTDYGGNARNSLPAIGAWQYSVLGRVAVDTITGSTLGTYANLREALAAINAGAHQGALHVKIKYNTFETNTASLQASGTGGASYLRILITPSGGRNISVVGRFNLPLFLFDGASQVKIDGLNSGGNALQFIQFGTGIPANTIGWVNGASQDTVTRCTILGSTLASSTDVNGRGILWFGSSTGSTGNNQNVVSYNRISHAGSSANRPYNALYSFGTTALENTGNRIEHNEFFNFIRPVGNSFGIHLLQNNTQWVIANNSFYETTSFSPIATAEYRIINVVNTAGGGFQIRDNYIGGTAVQCGGSPWVKTNSSNNIFYGIYISSSSSASEIQGNTVSNIQWSNTGGGFMYGIWVHSGTVNIGTQTGNVIGATTGTGSIHYTGGTSGGGVYGMYFAAGPTVNAQNNTIGAIKIMTANNTLAGNFWGIFKTGSGNTTLINNTIGHPTTPHSIEATSASTGNAQSVFGIRSESSGTHQFTGNQIANLTNQTTHATVSVTGVTQGIYVSAGSHTISQNKIHHLRNMNLNNNGLQNASVGGIVFINTASFAQSITENEIYELSNLNPAFAGTITGIYYNGGTTLSLVSRNYIANLSVEATSTNANIYGIRINAGQTNYTNNIVYLNTTTASNLFGIYENGASFNHNNLYFNTIFIDGRPSNGNNASYALWSNASTNTRNFRNNIFVNNRSNTGSASGSHFAAYFNYTANTNLTLDFNTYWASGQGGVLGYFNNANVTSLPLVPSRDAASLSVSPNFSGISPVTTANFYPKVQLNGTTIAGFTNDYNGANRTSPPSMGALEAFLWTGATDHQFNVATNWAGGLVPLDNSLVRFAAAPSNPCILDQNRRLSNVINEQSTHGFHLNGFVLTLTDSLALSNGATITANTAGSQLFIQSSKIQWLDPAHFAGQEVHQLRVACTSGINLLGALTVLDQLTLEEGIITLNNGTLSIGSFAGTADSSKYIRTTGAGALATTIGSGASFTFPVGNATYNPVTITNHNPTDVFSVKVRDNVPNNSFLSQATYVNRTWDITKQQPNTASGVDFEFNWKANEIAANQGPLTQAVLNHFNGSVWENASGAGISSGQNGVATSLVHTGYVGSFSPFAISSDVTPLPVTLTHFSAQCEAERIRFDWSTEVELNNSHFTLEQSINMNEWQTIAQIPGHGNSNSPTHYHHVIPLASLTQGAYFRLNQVDFDGKTTNYAPTSVEEGCLPQKHMPSIFPNPNSGRFTLTEVSPYSSWTLIDAMGKALFTIRANEHGEIHVDENLPTGLYLMQGDKEAIKLVIRP